MYYSVLYFIKLQPIQFSQSYASLVVYQSIKIENFLKSVNPFTLGRCKYNSLTHKEVRMPHFMKYKLVFLLAIIFFIIWQKVYYQWETSNAKPLWKIITLKNKKYFNKILKIFNHCSRESCLYPFIYWR